MLSTIPWSRELRTAADAFGDLPAASDGEAMLSYRDLAGRAARVATALLEQGLAPGEPVAVCLRNGIPAVWASYGVKIAGAAEVPLNPAYGPEDRRYCLALAGVKRALAAAAEAPALAALGCEVLAVDDLADRPGNLATLPPVPAEAWGRITFTSGTTGRPKAIVHTHGARWIANLLQRAHFVHMPVPGSRVLLMTPYTHGAALIANGFLDHGGTAVVLDGVDLAKVERLLVRGEVDHIFAPPTVLAKLAGAFTGRRFPGVRVVFTGTAPLTPALYEKARALFGPVLRVTYGKSEIVNPIAVLPPQAAEQYYREEGEAAGVCVGWPGSGVEIEVRDEAGSTCATGEIGEVHLRGRHMLAGWIDARGFHDMPPDGWHATGDLGRLDERGRLHLVGRTADVIKSGGYKIHPLEIEAALAGSAGDAAVAVVALSSEYWGEVIVAVAEGAAPDWPARARAAVAGLARFKQPRAYLTLDALPRNAQGKVPRARLRDLVLERWALEDGPQPKLTPRR